MISVKNLVSFNSATVPFGYLLSQKRRLFIRVFFWSSIVLFMLISFSFPVWDRLCIQDFFGLALPYFICLWIWLLLAHLVRKYPNYFLGYLILGLLHIIFSFYGAYFYFYEFLPQYDIILFTKPIDGHHDRFIVKLATAHLIFILMASVDYYFWDKIMLNIQVRALLKKDNNLTTNRHISIHFLKSLLAIVNRSNLDNWREVNNFFQYVITNISQARSYVALEEEWRNLKILISICTHRRIELYGENLLSDKDWNRSVPAICLLTWMENAITYSPSHSDFPIELKWSNSDEGLQLAISNQISKSAINTVKAGQGLKLLDAVFVDTKYDVDYKKSNDQKFEVRFTLK